MREGVLQIDGCAPGLRVVGCSCPWAGTTDDMLVCEDGILTPGDPCPAGRCATCGELVYLDRPEDRAVLEVERLLAVVRVLVADVREIEGYWTEGTGDLLQDAEAILARIDGAKVEAADA